MEVPSTSKREGEHDHNNNHVEEIEVVRMIFECLSRYDNVDVDLENEVNFIEDAGFGVEDMLELLK